MSGRGKEKARLKHSCETTCLAQSHPGRGKMQTQLACLLLILACLQTGTSNTRITMWQERGSGVDLTVTCALSGDEKVSQVNWERVQGANHSKLAVYHIDLGTHIPTEHQASLELFSPSSTRSVLVLKGGRLDANDTYCCTFITFPSGSLQQCLDVTTPTVEARLGDEENVTGGWLVLAGIAAVPCVALLMITVIAYRRSCNSRRRVFNVQQSISIEDLEDSEEPLHLPLQSQPSINSHNSNYYIMINADYYNGRPGQGEQEGHLSAVSHLFSSPHPFHKTYYLLGEVQPEKGKANLQKHGATSLPMPTPKRELPGAPGSCVIPETEGLGLQGKAC
nr:PREDICTED: uncharacterized protein LOC107076616 isoform X1 [Lepisosteus oculatus]